MCNIQFWFRHLRILWQEDKELWLWPTYSALAAVIWCCELWDIKLELQVSSWGMEESLLAGISWPFVNSGHTNYASPHLFPLRSGYDWWWGTAEKILMKIHETWVLVLISHPFAVRSWTYHEATQWHLSKLPSNTQPGTVLDDGHMVGARQTMQSLL